MLTDLWNLFIAFLRASNLGFGGGPAIIPLIQAEAVERYQWMTNSEFTDAIAVANALPGPIATKIASYIGFKVASWPGVIVAIAATILPTIIILILLGNLLAKYSNSKGLKAMLTGVRPIITALLVVVAYEMAVEAFKIHEFIDIFTVIIAIGAAAGLYFWKAHPVLLIVLSMVAGYLIF